MQIYEQKLNVNYDSLDFRGLMTVPYILNVSQYISSTHYRVLGFDFFEFKDKFSGGWIIISSNLEVFEYPKYNDNIVVKTYLSKRSMLKETREVEFWLDDKLLVKNSTVWVFFNPKEKKPLPITKTLGELFDVVSDCTSNSALEFPNSNILNKEHKAKIFYQEIDMLNHLNNVQYINKIFSCYPHSFFKEYRVRKMTLNYLQELYGDDEIVIKEFINPEEKTEVIYSFFKGETESFKALIKWDNSFDNHLIN